MSGFFSSYKFTMSAGLLLTGLVIAGVGFFFLLDTVITADNAEKYSAIGTLLAAFIAMPALGVIVFQSYQLKNSVDVQAKDSNLSHRPHVYLEFKLHNPPVWQTNAGSWFGGGDLYFRNSGKSPATIIYKDYMVASDRSGVIDFVGWHEKDHIGFPDIKVVFPNQDGVKVPCHPIISGEEKPRLLYISAVIHYKGPEKGKVYWYYYSETFAIQFGKFPDRNGTLVDGIVLHPVTDHDWDDNTEKDPPKLAEPNWEYLLSKIYVKRITQ